MKFFCYLTSLLLLFSLKVCGQHHHETAHAQPESVVDIEAQPFLAQAFRVGEALTAIGSALPAAAINQLQALKRLRYDQKTVRKVQEILDPYCLATIEINPESRVKVTQGLAQPTLMQEGWTTFLVKVHNQAHITAALQSESPNAQPVFHKSGRASRVKEENKLTLGQIDNRFLEISFYRERPLQFQLSGLGLEYAVIQFYTREKGKREAKIGFNVGQGTQDIGFRNAIDILFDIKPAIKIIFDVKDENNSPTTASFIITDGIERFGQSKIRTSHPGRYPWRDWEEPGDNKFFDTTVIQVNKLRGIYPLPGRRVAARDEFPDFFFQPQVYRADGEFVYLPPGKYQIIFGRGPEYQEQQMEIVVPENKDSIRVNFRLKRWVHMAALGWYSADHHIHAGGCAHYESPEEGVRPEQLFRQIQGEDLNLGIGLNWGPSWYNQKQYFTGTDHPLSDKQNILHYDVEVSDFPSAHAGHLGLLNLKEDDFPNTNKIEEWPSWTLPVLRWAKQQGGVTGYVHSGWGLAPIGRDHIRYLQEGYTNELPNYVTPRMDGIGANEYIVTVTYGVVDFYGLGNTPIPNELNMWYHTLNCGFRVRIAGETDFPCITDQKVGLSRTYAKLDSGLNFSAYMKAIKSGRSYVSDGFSHLIDFTVNGVSLGKEESESELSVPANTTLNVAIKSAAFLTEIQDETGAFISSRAPNQQPYWNIERAREGSSRKVPVELIVNGRSVEKQEITANGNWNNLKFNYKIEKSSWLAIRIYGSSHTNPIFVIVDKKPIMDKKSAVWCRDAVDQCWKMKNERIRKEDLGVAKEAYDQARKVYEKIIQKAD